MLPEYQYENELQCAGLNWMIYYFLCFYVLLIESFEDFLHTYYIHKVLRYHSSVKPDKKQTCQLVWVILSWTHLTITMAEDCKMYFLKCPTFVAVMVNIWFKLCLLQLSFCYDIQGNLMVGTEYKRAHCEYTVIWFLC